MKEEIPLPVTFNPYKHHFRFLKYQIKIWKKLEWEIVEPELLNLGENLLDLYVGELSVDQIYRECIEYIHGKGVLKRSEFSHWLGNKEYRKIRLSDNSVWIIKTGLETERYIHIHPAKLSHLSIRVRAITLKTVLALQIRSFFIQTDMNKNINTVNSVRKNNLNLSTIKNLHPEKGILKIWKMFEANK